MHQLTILDLLESAALVGAHLTESMITEVPDGGLIVGGMDAEEWLCCIRADLEHEA